MPKAAVTSWYVPFDKVAVNVSDDPAFSAMDEALVARVNVGADSLSVIVIVTAWVPFSEAPPPLTAEIDTPAVSLEVAS